MTRVVLVTGANRGIGQELARRLDVTDPASIEQVATDLDRRYGRLDVLVNNAAIHYDTWQQASTADLQVVREALEVNLLGPWQTSLTLLPLLRVSGHGRIVNVSSEAGSLAGMNGGPPAYNVSKAALNALTRMLASDLRRDRILVNAVCPGWVATDMGGPGGRPVAEGAASVLWAVDLPTTGLPEGSTATAARSPGDAGHMQRLAGRPHSCSRDQARTPCYPAFPLAMRLLEHRRDGMNRGGVLELRAGAPVACVQCLAASRKRPTTLWFPHSS
jgi:NAD(P)-dependent dehydrogenase (short-subunit alcohol dehydrogenase family)